MRKTLAAASVLAGVLTALAPVGVTQAQADPSPQPSSSAAPPTQSAEPSPSTPPAAEPFAFEEPRWREVKTDDGPAGREDHTWTVDADGRFAYLYGGRTGARELGDLWRYDLRRDRWQRLSPSGRSPAPRFGHSAAWVEGSGLVIFAGQRGADFFADLWAYDPDRRRWRELPARGSVPKARYGSCLVVGRDGRLWISHGFTTAGRFDDTRAYNLTSRRWAVRTPAGRKPGERCLHDCFTSLDGELVLYGGQDDGAFALGDLWAWRGERWTRLDDPPLAARRLYAVTEAGAHAFVFGGAGPDNEALDDLWRVDRRTLDFERVRTAGPSRPDGRYAATLITDTARGRLLVFGGQASSTRSDVWELVEVAPRTSAVEPAAEPSPSGTTPAPSRSTEPSAPPA